MLNRLKVREKLTSFYIEDSQNGDLATHIFDEAETGTLTLLSKDTGIFCGRVIIEEAFNLFKDTHVDMKVAEGDAIRVGQTLAEITGSLHTLLTMERIVLNLVQRMSGIATMTNRIAKSIAHTDARLVDTRKTTPGLQMFEKHAVTVGGGLNHRRSLNDGLMLKDNHIDFCGSLENAIERAKQLVGPTDVIEVEIENEEMLRVAIDKKVDIIMFDNQTPKWIKNYINLVPNEIKTEASGNVTEDNIVAYAETGVDFISMGALFYSQKALDISAKVVL